MEVSNFLCSIKYVVLSVVVYIVRSSNYLRLITHPMFGSGKETKKDFTPKDRSSRSSSPKTSSSGSSAGGVNTIDEHTTITGDLEAGGDIRIDGKLIGDLVCHAKLIIGSGGFVDGEVTCEQAMIEGKFCGSILVRDLLTLKDSANVSGTIRAKKLAVGSGCIIDGQCTVTGNSDPAAASAPTKQQSSGKHTPKSKNGAPVTA